MLKRPTADETEEDLLRLQREFLSNKTPTAVTVVRRPEKHKTTEDCSVQDRDVVHMEGLPAKVPDTVNQAVPPAKKSRFRASRDEELSRTHKVSSTEDDAEERIEKHDTHMTVVLSKIIERDTHGAVIQEPSHVSQPFPNVFDSQSHQQKLENGSVRKQSLFAQHFDKMTSKKTEISADVPMDLGVYKGKEDNNSESTSHMVEGTGLSATFGKEEARKIHQENLNMLSNISQDEILAEQRKLLESLDPNLINFLTQKKEKEDETYKPPTSQEPLRKKGKKTTPSKSDERTSDLPLQPKKEWLHMNKVETDKLSWMKDLPLPQTAVSETGQPARFDFQGNLVPADADVPVTMGLHHHGDEPERAGYTLEELFLLARSSNVQQRMLSLNTLGKVLSKARAGDLESLVQSPVLPAVLDAGVVFLLRWAMDDNMESVMAAAIAAMSGLLVSYADQVNQDRVLPWFRGFEVCSRRPAEVTKEIQMPIMDEEEMPEETDADIVKKDVLMALVTRMSLLPRFHYILDTMHPQAPTALHILDILTSIAQHSAQLAYQIVQFQKLLNLIVSEFLPLGWRINTTDRAISSVYGIGVPAAMRLMRAIAQAGRNMAATLLNPSYKLQARILLYLADDGNIENLQLPETEAFDLQVETLYFWRVCLLYGFTSDTFMDMYPTLVRNLQELQMYITNENPNPQLLRKHVGMVMCMEAALHVASLGSKPEFKASGDGSTFEMDTSEEVAMPTLAWSHVSDLIHPILIALPLLLKDIQNTYQFKKQDLQLHTVCLGFVSTFFSLAPSQPGYSAVDHLTQLECVWETNIAPLWKSFGFQLILRNLSSHSNLLNIPNKKKEISASLPDLGCCSRERSELSITKQSSPYGFLTSVLRLILGFCKAHKGLLSKVQTTIVMDEDILSYMKKIAENNPSHLHSNYFTKFENQFQYFYLKLVTMTDMTKITQHVWMLHRAALCLLQHLLYGDEYMAHDLLSTVIFLESFWQPDEVARVSLSQMRLSDSIHLQSATQDQIHVTHSQLLSDAMTKLSSIRATYLSSFSHSEQDVYRSRCRFYVEPMKILTFFTSHIGECLFPTDWMFYPLIQLYNKISSVKLEQQNKLVSSQVEGITNILQWIFLLESQRSEVTKSISVTLKISRLMCVFLTGNDLFLEQSVHCYLAALLREYTRPALLQQMNFEEDIPGVTTFYDLYIEFLQQYQAVSFGDSLFGCYVLLPLQQKHSLRLRKAVWTEYCSLLRTLSIPIHELLIPIQSYLDPEETDIQLIRLYLQGLLSRTARPQWSPVMYLIAVHHVNRFIYRQDAKHRRLKRLMFRQILDCKHEELKEHLLNYKLYCAEKEFGIELYTELPTVRQTLIQTITEEVT